MSYIGQRPVVGRYIKLDQISSGFNGSETSFSMTAGSQAVFPGTARNLLLSLGGVIQEPDTNFTISGSTLTFTTAPVANTTFFAVIFGDMQSTGTPSDGTVLPASIASSGNFSFPQLTVTGTSSLGDDVTFTGANYNVVWDKSDNALEFADNAVAAFGNGSDLTITHDATNTHIRNNTGTLNLRADSVRLTDAVIGHVYLAAATGGSTDLYYDNSKKFETLTDGVKISGKTLSLINPSNFQDSTFTLEHGSSTVGNKHTIDFKDQNGSSTQIISYGSSFGSSKDNALEIKTSTTSNGDPTTRLTFFEDGKIQLPDNGKATFGTGDDLQIYHDGSHSYALNTTGNFFLGSNNSVDIGDGDFTEYAARFKHDNAAELYYDNSKKFETTSYGNLSASQVRVASSNTASVAFSVGDVNTGFYNSGSHAIGYAAQGTQMWNIDSAGNLRLNDSVKAYFGTSNDLQIYHNGNHSFIEDAGTGNLFVKTSSFQLENAVGNETLISAVQDGAVELYYDSSLKLNTTANGVTCQDDLAVLDNNKLTIGTGDDLQIYHDGTNSYIKNTTGALVVPTATFALKNAADNENIISAFENGAVELYYDNSKRFHTTTSGAQITGHLFMDDDDKIRLGNSQDLEIYHDGTDSYIDSSTGKLYIKTSNFVDIRSSGNETMIKAIPNGAVELYYDNSKKLNTHPNGIFVQGIYPMADNSYNIGSSTQRFINIYATSGTVNTSDKNVKNTIVNSDLGLDFINKLNPVSYKWNEDDGKTHYGLIAQDVEETLTSIGKTIADFGGIYKEDDSPMGLGYSELVAPLIKAIQELSAEVAALKAA